MKETEIKKLVELESRKLYSKRPRLKKISFTYEKQKDGFFTSRLSAHTTKNEFQLSKKSKCIKSGIKEVFKGLKRMTNKEKLKVRHTIIPNFKEAI